MATNVRVNLFEVTHKATTQKLSDTLMAFAKIPIAQRHRADIRLEQVTHVLADAVVPHDQFHLEFAKERQIGPGRMSRTAAISNVGLLAMSCSARRRQRFTYPVKNGCWC